MNTPLQVFDLYEMKARILPGIIVLAPLVLSTYLWYPQFLSLDLIGLNLIIFMALIFLLANLSRDKGFEVQKGLLLKWGGFPTTRFLSLSDNKIDRRTKDRYHSFINKNIWNINLPSSIRDEEINFDSYKVQYESSIKWLKEMTRDRSKYPIIFKDNINYGFSRNLLGLKKVGILTAIAALLLNLGGIIITYDLFIVPFQFYVAVAICILFLYVWLSLINEKLVERYAESYALSLLAACENIQKKKEDL